MIIILLIVYKMHKDNQNNFIKIFFDILLNTDDRVLNLYLKEILLLWEKLVRQAEKFKEELNSLELVVEPLEMVVAETLVEIMVVCRKINQKRIVEIIIDKFVKLLYRNKLNNKKMKRKNITTLHNPIALNKMLINPTTINIYIINMIIEDMIIECMIKDNILIIDKYNWVEKENWK